MDKEQRKVFSFIWSHASPFYAVMYDVNGEEIEWEVEPLFNIVLHPEVEYLSIRDVYSSDGDYDMDILLKKMWIERRKHSEKYIQAVREFLTDRRRLMESISYILAGDSAKQSITGWIKDRQRWVYKTFEEESKNELV